MIQYNHIILLLLAIAASYRMGPSLLSANEGVTNVASI